MTIWYIDIMWGLMLLGVALFCGICVIFNPAMRPMRIMALVVAYAVFAWMLYALQWRVAVATWLVFATLGGVVCFAYELWARFKFRGTGRAARPLILLQGFVLWPMLVPDAIEGVVVDLGILVPAEKGG